MISDRFLLHLSFAHWYLQQTAAYQTFPADVLFTDEAAFSRSYMFNVNKFLPVGFMMTHMTEKCKTWAGNEESN